MALNPPLSHHGLPLRVEGEFMVLERKSMEIEIKIDGMKKISGKGKVYLTTARMVFVNKDFAREKFKAFDIPLAYLSQEKFEQPVFGSNYLKGQTKPLYNMIPADAHFKIWFTAGGCTTFLKCFCFVVDQIRNKRKPNSMPDENFVNHIRSGSLANQQAFVDPNDPTMIFVAQPEETYSNQVANQGNYIGENYYGNQQNAYGYGLNDQNANTNQYIPPSNPQINPPQQPYSDPNYQQPSQNYQPQYNQGYQPPQQQFNMEIPQNQNQPQTQTQPQPQLQQPNVGYYYGFWGPDLNRR